jgi:hypothetical protein
MIGLVVDGGLILAHYRRAQIAADTAAHAASHQISIEVFMETNQVVLSAVAMEEAIKYARYNSHAGQELVINEISILDEGRLVRVTGQASLPTAFMRLVGIPEVNVTVVGKAYPAYGIDEEWQ